MASLQFLQFPLDIKTFIISYITRPADLRSLCLVSREIRTIATPELYRRVSLTVGGDRDLLLSAMLGRDNPGLGYIREISIYLLRTHLPTQHRQHDEFDSSEDEEGSEWGYSISARQAHFTMRLLLDFLPTDILEDFSWEAREPFSVGNWLLLAKRQRKLRTIEVGPMQQPLLPYLRKDPGIIKNLQSIRSLYIVPYATDTLIVGQMFLEANPDIQNLYIASDFGYSGETRKDLHDRSTGPALLTRTLFSHLLPFRQLYHTFCAQGTPCLETLEIINCQGAGNLFGAVSKLSFRPPRLKTIRWYHDETNDSHSSAAFEGFLEVVSSLHTLHVDVVDLQSLPKVAAVTRHGQTLISLSIHSQKSNSQLHTYCTKEIEDMCSGCPKLWQLAIAFPMMNVDYTELVSEFDFCLRATRELHRLASLNITQWPVMREPPLSGPYGRLNRSHYEHYEHQLQSIAQSAFELSDAHASRNGYGLGTRSCLSVIAFGGNGKSNVEFLHEEIELKQVPFVRGTKIDAFGKLGVLAVKTEWRMVQFVEPESDILDHSFYDLHDVHSGPS